MLKRLFGSDSRSPSDSLPAVTALLRSATPEEAGGIVLKRLAEELGGDVRGYLVHGDDEAGYAFAAVHGYSLQMTELTVQQGPWRDPGPRAIPNLVQELFSPNDKETRAALGGLGLRKATASLVVPVSSEEATFGALIVHRHEGERFRDDDLRRVAQWGEVLGEALGRGEALRKTRLSLVEFTRAFVEAVEAQDFTQLGHGARVASYALALGRTLELPRGRLADLYFAATLHDIGKLGSADLSSEDESHPARGANLVASSPLLQDAAPGIRHHHERWDGTGFPDELAGKSIPLLARIVAVADAFDLLSSERGSALPMHEVEKMLHARAGADLDPELVRVMINLLRQGKSTAELARVRHTDLPF